MLYFAYLVVVTFLLAELSLSYLYSLDASYSYSGYFQEVYMQKRDIIQYNDDCAMYDVELFYKLRPGHCMFGGREFLTSIMSNSMGLRDDEKSLLAPEIIILGDSHSMGWGVQKEETFSDILEKRTGLNTLNAAVSSFGTVRELRLLGKLDTSKLRYLIIQYCENDIEENSVFRSPDDYKASARKVYEEAKKTKDSFRFGNYSIFAAQYIYSKLRSILRNYLKPIPDAKARQNEIEANLFLQLLNKSEVIRKNNFPIYVFEVNGRARNDKYFIKALRGILEKGMYPELSGRLVILDASTFLNESEYFKWDDHINKHGHEKLSGYLLKLIAQ